MKDLTIQQARAAMAKASILSAVLSMLVVAAGYGLALQLEKPHLAYDIAMAGGLLLFAGFPGLALAVALVGKVRGGAAMGFVAGIIVRMPAGGVLALYGLNWGLAKTASFSQIVAAAYLVFLVIEVLCLSPAVKRTAAIDPQMGAQINAPRDTPTPGDEESV